ncbi:hypothetical protein SLA2020_050410 [Shorea laevis]
MKKKVSGLLKQIVSLLGSIAKAKSITIKRTIAAKARLIMFSSLMKNKRALMGSISNKINNLLDGHHDEHEQECGGDQSKAIVLYNAMVNESYPSLSYVEEKGDTDEINVINGRYLDLRHPLFDEEMDLERGSVIELMRNRKEEGGEEFRLEDEIDHLADLFITRFHKQMRLQKLLSFKSYQEMLERSI